MPAPRKWDEERWQTAQGSFQRDRRTS